MKRLAKLRSVEVFHLVPRDAQQPSDERGLSREGVELLEGHQEHVLHDIVDKVRSRREPPRDVAVDRIDVSLHELGGSLAVSLQDGGDQRPFVIRVRLRLRCRRGCDGFGRGGLGSHL